MGQKSTSKDWWGGQGRHSNERFFYQKALWECEALKNWISSFSKDRDIVYAYVSTKLHVQEQT